ncbi:MAG: hypothetical protein JWP30_624 [Homoserinimonas sp.]|nr:hypothetical protein [Homoserinimonas sp.]
MTSTQPLPHVARITPIVADWVANPGERPLALPAPPTISAKQPFPFLACLTPVVGALVIWGITGSPFALIFAFLGPVIAVASVADGSLHARRTRARERARFAADGAELRDNIRAAHMRERRSLEASVIDPRNDPSSLARSPDRWGDDLSDRSFAPITVTLGHGTVASTLTIMEAAVLTPERNPSIAHTLATLREQASRLTDAPITADARRGIGVCGSAVIAGAIARSVVAQLALRLSPSACTVVVPSNGSFDWLYDGAHTVTQAGGTATLVRFQPTDGAGADVVVAVCSSEDELPRECHIIIKAEGTSATVNFGTRQQDWLFRALCLSVDQTRAIAQALKRRATLDGICHDADAPGTVAFGELPQQATGASSLPATIGKMIDGHCILDLVSQGPHAVVGGTTGSGKSELLVTWVLAMASAHPPSAVNFLLVDFKGGASFASVQQLPHSVGIITDLDASSAERALVSLKAEMRHRERTLASLGARAIEDVPDAQRMPRLVIIVDEFAAVVTDFPDLHGLFADLVSRGRSLGVHLILCTQRPGGVIRDAVMANCGLRLSLRVNNAADSIAVLGTVDAVGSALQPGAAFVGAGGAKPCRVQVARSTADDADRVGRLWPAQPVRRPWRDALPETVRFAHLSAADSEAMAVLRAETQASPVAGPRFTFGLADWPEEQRQPVAVFTPRRDGNLLVLGGHRSGKSAFLAILATAGVPTLRVPVTVEGAWDAVSAATEYVGDDRVLLIDDVDALMDRFTGDYHQAFLDLLTRVLREGPGTGTWVVLAAQRMTASLQSLAALCDTRLILRLPNRQEHALAGGESAQYAATLPPGGGFWQGHRVQVACAPKHRQSAPVAGSSSAASPEPARHPLGEDDLHHCAIVTTQPTDVARQLKKLGITVLALTGAPAGALIVETGPVTYVGDHAAWQARWGALAALQQKMPVLIEHCTPAEYRALTGSRALAPPIGNGPGGAWMITPEGGITRVQLPLLLTNTRAQRYSRSATASGA